MFKSKSEFLRGTRRGFSMIELLAVVGIISVMAVIIGVSLGGKNESLSVGNGQRIASSVFQSARSIAVLRQAHTRVIIYRDHANDPQKFLRYMGVVYLKDGVNLLDATVDDWIPANQGTYLPEGVFYVPDDVVGLTGVNIDTSDYGNDLLVSDPNYSGTSTMSAKFPVVGSSSSEDYYFYQFDKNGMSDNPGGYFVINAADTGFDGTDETVDFKNPLTVSGFAIRRIGGVTLFSDYEEVQSLSN